MIRAAVITALTLVFLMSTGLSGAHSEEDKLKGLDLFIKTAMKQYGVPGVSVAVVKDGDVIYLKGHGIRKTGTEEKVDENTIFQLASVTKTFTAASVASMVDRGKIGLDQEVVTIIPNFALKDPYPTRYTTPRDLLAHRTGLPALTGDLFDHLGYTREEVVKRVRYIEPACSFREKANYSNIGYFLAGEVAAYSAGRPWEDVVVENLLTPLEMKRTGFTKTLAQQSNVASPQAVVAGEVRTIPNNLQLVLGPAGAMTSTATDLSHYMLMLLDGGKYRGREVLKEDSVKAIFTPAMVDKPGFAEFPPISENTGFDYGLSWGIYYWQNYKILEKGGALDGIRSVVVLVPEIRLGIAVLANMNLTALPEAIRAYVLEEYLGKAGYDIQSEIMQRWNRLASMFGLSNIVEPKHPGPASKKMADYTGIYENDLYGRFSVVTDGDRLKVEAGPAKYTGSLTHVNYDTFYLKWPIFISAPDELTFLIDAKGNVTEFIDDTLGRFKKVDRTP